jgi:putative membrane-bound dehydrogenase-like protein
MNPRVTQPAAPCARLLVWIILTSMTFFGWSARAAESGGPSDGNRLIYLDDPTNPFYPNLKFPKLITPQWIGEPGVEAVVVLAVDDMSDTKKYETFLRPILDRLKQIDGRTSMSIMTCKVEPQDPQLQSWLAEGVSIEVHTLRHPCPFLANGNFDAAAETVNGCIDLVSQIPNTRPVAFRMPCCDSINSLSPRFFAEIFNGVTSNHNFLQLDSSVFNITTTNDTSLPRDFVLDADGKEKFRKYLPFPAYSATIDDYPYPYVIGNVCWEFPCAVPSDWEAQNVLKSNNPKTVADWKNLLDIIVRKQGVFNLVFHPHNWIRNDQIVELIDYATIKYGRKVKFLSFKEAAERLNKNLLAGQPLRATDGRENGVRLIDVNHDGILDVVIGNETVRKTRVWHDGKWIDTDFPGALANQPANGQKEPAEIEFGVLQTNGFASMFMHSKTEARAWHFDGSGWVEHKELLNGLEVEGRSVFARAPLGCIRFHDLDKDGFSELIIGSHEINAVFQWSPAKQSWERLSFALPDGVRFADNQGHDAGFRFIDLNGDGLDDIIFSNEKNFSVHLFNPEEFFNLPRGWTTKVKSGTRGEPGEIPMITRGGPHPNNGAWFRNDFLWVQNEDTAKLKDIVDRRSFKDLITLNAEPAKSPAESLACLKVRPGFKVELAASEPMIESPVAFEWGADGKLWVVEMIDYPQGVGGKGASKVRFLEDTHGDGKYDKSTIFLDGLSFPNGIYPWRKGVLISDPPDILYAEDTDGDGKADVKKVLFTGFNPGNPQHRANGYDYGLDNWFYGANGDSGGRVTSVMTRKKVSINGRDFRFRPDTGEFEAESGMTQFGRHRDDWGNWFGNDNPEWLWHFIFPEHYLARNPFLPVKENKRMLANYADSKRVFAISKPMERFNDPIGAENVTSGNSPTPYRDDLFGPDFASSVFSSEPVHNVVHREVLEPDGVTFKSRRADDEKQIEFLASTDNWTRPTMSKTGPDGALYVADMYRLVIEHPEWISRSRQAAMDLRAGADKGRIYRVYPATATLRKIPHLDKLNTLELVAALDSPNGWQRDTAQRLLVEAHDAAAIEPLNQLINQRKRPKTRLQALCTLDGLGGITTAILVNEFQDPEHHIREHAVRLSENLLKRDPKFSAKKNTVQDAIDPQFISSLLKLADDPEIRVRFQLAFSLGEWGDPRAAEILAKIALKDSKDSYVQTAVLSSASKHLSALLMHILQAAEPPAGLVEKLLALAVAQGDEKVSVAVLTQISKPAGPAFASWQFSALAGFLDALDRKNSSLSEFYNSGNTKLRQAVKQLDPMFAQARALAKSSSNSAMDPSLAGAVRLLGRGLTDRESDLKLLGDMLEPQIAPAAQKVALSALKRVRGGAPAQLLLAHWNGYGPEARTEVLTTLTSRPEWLRSLLAEIENGKIPASQIGQVFQQSLLKHPDENISERAAKLFASNPDRTKIIHQYDEVPKLAGDRDRGHALFTQNCAPCHRVHDEGNVVGPDLGMLADKPADVFLTAILNPNQAVEARYINYNAMTKNGREISGVIATETSSSLTLKSAGGIEETILRSDLTELKSSGLSLMPEGFENILKPQDMADLIAFLKGR